MRILVVDDSRVARSVLKKVLGEIGHSIVNEASDGAEALVKLRQADFDLVITDWNMPRLDGIGLVRAITKAPELDVPVLMVSGETYTTRFVEVIRAGAQGYLPKPFTADALRIKIAEIAKKQAMKREGEAATMSGRLAEVGFPELVQFVSSCALTGRLIIQHDEMGVPVHGLLEVRSGNVIAAYCGDHAGDEAVYAIAEWDEGLFRFQPDERAVVANTTMPTLTLLMEAMKRRDEKTIDASH